MKTLLSVEAPEAVTERHFPLRPLDRLIFKSGGFSLPELLVTLGLVAVIGGITVPLSVAALGQYRLDGAARAVGGQIRSARLAAVTSNRTMRVRFNCPAVRSYRAVEITGNAAIDDAADRCTLAWPDPDPNAAPNVDGPPMWLPDDITFGATQDLRISPAGVITPVTGAMPALIQVTDGTQTVQITVSAAGRIQTP